MKNYDTASTLIGLIPGSALMICLGGWLGAGGVAIFLIYAICSETPKETTPLQGLKEVSSPVSPSSLSF